MEILVLVQKMQLGRNVLVEQEKVKVEKMIFIDDQLLVLHRPHKDNLDHHSLWRVSDAASGIGISQSISENLAIKMAQKRMKLHKRRFLEDRKKLLGKVVFK